MKIKMKKKYTDYLSIHEFKTTWIWDLILFIALILTPFYIDSYLLFLLSLCGIYTIVSLGLNLLAGYAGQISLGHAAFYAIGAYSSTILIAKASFPFLLALPLSGLITVISGLVVGLAAFRLAGLYLAIATMGFGFIVDELILRWVSLTNGSNGYSLKAANMFGYDFSDGKSYFYIILFSTTIMLFFSKNILRSHIGRSFVAIRDSESAARAVGINVAKTKLIAFGISTFYAGIGGCLFAHLMRIIGPDSFTISQSILFLAMVIVGGLGSLTGAVMGAIFLTIMPESVKIFMDSFPSIFRDLTGLESFLYGLIIVVFLIYEPLGLYGRWLKIKFYWEMFPFYRKETFKKQRKFSKTIKN